MSKSRLTRAPIEPGLLGDGVEIREFPPQQDLPQFSEANLRIDFPDDGLSCPPSARHLEPGHGSIELPGGNPALSYRLIKRTIDLVGALFLLLLLSPLLITTWVILLITTKGRPIFLQERVGLCGRTFTCIKFRTMVVNAEQIQHLIKNEQEGPIFKNLHDPRITRIGAILRKTSIDELPQLLNVVLGQMSLVGPRPALADEVKRYQDWQTKRLSVKPGLTCLWQVSGRSDIRFDEWMRMDLWYVEQQCLSVDLMLLLRTPWVVLTCRGAC